MSFAEKIRAFIEKLQNLSDRRKKIILWAIVAIVAAVMGFFWVRGVMDGLSKMSESAKSVKFPEIDTSGMPSLDILGNTALGDSNKTAATQPASQKTYTNNDYGFEIKYPASLSLKEDSSSGNIISARLEEGGYGLYSFYAGTSDEKNIAEAINPKSSDYTEIINGKSVVNDISWITIEELNIPQEGIGTAGSSLIMFVKNGVMTYVFQCINCDADMFGTVGANKKLVFDQMISTFKFIK